MHPGSVSRPGRMIMAAIVLVALAGMEWWVTDRQDDEFKLTGVVAGAALMGLLVACTVVLNRSAGSRWSTSAAAALMAVLELILGAFALGLLSALAVLLLPFSISATFLMNDMATDVVIYSVLGLALWVAARSWWRYAGQQAQVVRIQVAAAQTQAMVAQRDRELAQSELMVLRAQIEPHFLWNTLAHVQYLIRKNPDDADRMTGYLIRYLRSAVPQIRGDASTLGVEFESVRAYLELMKIRMGERLTVDISLPDQLADHLFSPLLVQTLLENAIKHGVEPKVGPVHVRVSAMLDETDPTLLVIEVQDNGVGLQADAATRGTGLGLRSVRERLHLLYGGHAALSIVGAPAGGVIARMVIPLNGVTAP